MPGCAYGVYSNNGCVGHLFREPDISERRVRGVSAPRDEVLLFRQKDPKTIGARAWPQGGAFATVPIAWAAELASLRQSSPQNRLRDWGAATPEGAGR